MATLIKSNGEESYVEPKNGHEFTLEELQGLVGGYIEMVPLSGQIIVCDEEGLLKGLPVNKRATIVARALGWSGDSFVGNVVICDKKYIR